MPNKKPELPFDGYKWISKFAAHEFTRPILNTISIETGNRLGYTCERLAVACDGYRMALLPVPDDMPLGYMPIHNKPLPPIEALGNYIRFEDIVPVDLPFILQVNTRKLLDILLKGRGMGDCVYLLWQKNPDSTHGLGTLYLYFPSYKGKMVDHIPATMTEGLDRVELHGMIPGNIHSNGQINMVVNTDYLITALRYWSTDHSTLIGLSKNNHMITVEPDIDNNNHPLAVIMLIQPGYDLAHPSFYKARLECKAEPVTLKAVSPVAPRYAVLVYQNGIANVFTVDSLVYLSDAGRNAKRVFQGSFNQAEYFARGMGAAGVRVRTAGCSLLGDIRSARWTTDLESLPFSDKLIDLHIN